MVFYNGMGLKLIKNIDTQWALSKQRNFLGTKQATAKLGGEAGTASPAEPEAQAFHLWGMVFASLLQTILGELLMPIDMIRTNKVNIMIKKPSVLKKQGRGANKPLNDGRRYSIYYRHSPEKGEIAFRGVC